MKGKGRERERERESEVNKDYSNIHPLVNLLLP